MNNQIKLTIKLLALMLVSYSTMADTMISIGNERTSGSYGLENDTDIKTTSFITQYTEDAWRFTINIPHISVKGDGSVIPGSSIGGSGLGFNPLQTSTTSLVERQSGLGDITTSISYAFPPKHNEYMFYELTGVIKWGTASASQNLGTGENDYSIDLFSVYEKHDLKPFLTLGYLTIGDTSLVDYNDVFFATAGMMYQMNSKTLISLAYDYQQASVDGTDDGKIAKLLVTQQFNKKWAANIYMINGFSDSVADSGIGFTLMRNF